MAGTRTSYGHDSESRDGPQEEAAGFEASADVKRLVGVVEETLRYSRERGYRGWDYCDGMSSKVLRALPVENQWVNLAFQETIKRSPINVRPHLLVEQRRNYKGTALFTMANFNAHRLTGDERYEREGRDLAEWLVENRTPDYSGYCGAHRHRIQHLGHVGYPEDPDAVSTSYGVKALLKAGYLDSDYAHLARTASEFVYEDLDYHETDAGARIDYVPPRDDDGYTLNAVSLGARLLIDLYADFGDDLLEERATKLLDYVVSRQRKPGGWTYRDPASASHLSMDNFHNGFIIEALMRYEEVTGRTRYDEALTGALDFYRRTLFDADGAPNFDESNAYPRDIHAATQGILVFSQAGDPEFARRIIGWLMGTLYAGDGQFYCREYRRYTKRITLMRWCQAWTAYAVSTYLMHRCGLAEPTRAMPSDEPERSPPFVNGD